MSGLGALFQRRGVQGINTVGLRELYSSRDSVFSLDVWRNPPWKVQYSAAAAPLQHLLDIAFGLPPLLEKWKNAKLNSLQAVACQNRHPDSRDSLSTAGMTDLLRDMLKIHDDMYTWHDAFWKTHQHSLQIALQCSTWQNHYFDPEEATEGKLFSTSYAFSHFPVAMTLIYYDCIRIQLFKNADEICTELVARSENSTNSGSMGSQNQYIATLDFLRGEELITSINRVLQCAEYFLDKDKRLVGPTSYMFAFHVSFSALCRLSKINPRGTYRRQIRWCRLISAKYEEARLASLTSLDIGKLISNVIEMFAFGNPG
ncbi:hypothetical protein G7Y79_00009g027490 [Physcia stellaris]|nr:hypothetical protein G7Y79_00009g027490 [Physcia stellaris]